MPVRILDGSGDGDAATISRGIRYSVNHGAKVINLSLEFDTRRARRGRPDIISAIGYAHDHGVVVVAAAGNEGVAQLAYPAADADSDLRRSNDARSLPGRLLQLRPTA